MKYITETPKQTEVKFETEVLVVGGGPSGIAAAVAAARAGAKTMLTERFGCFGGVISHVGIEGIAWYRHEGTIEAGGILKEIEDRAIAMDACTPEPQSTSQAPDVEMFKFIADQLVTDAGVIPLFHCFAVDAIVEDGVIKGVIFEGKGGRFAILAQVVIDCTGDADVAFRAGAGFMGPEVIAQMGGTPMTPVFNCNNVDTERFSKYIYEEMKPTYGDWMKKGWGKEDNTIIAEMFTPYLYKPFVDAIGDGTIELEEGCNIVGTYSSIHDSGEVTQMNVVAVMGKSCTDPEDLTEAELKGRRHIIKAMTALRKHAPGFENAKIRNIGMTIGTRASRIVNCKYRLTGEDVLGEGRFDDSIGIFPEFLDGAGTLILPLTGRYYQLPYRCTVPEDIDNMLVAGRSICGDLTAFGSYRNMGCCIATGQGVGVAAAVAVKDNVSTRDVDIKKVQKLLTEQGVRVF